MIRLEGTPIHSRPHREGWATDHGEMQGDHIAQRTLPPPAEAVWEVHPLQEPPELSSGTLGHPMARSRADAPSTSSQDDFYEGNHRLNSNRWCATVGPVGPPYGPVPSQGHELWKEGLFRRRHSEGTSRQHFRGHTAMASDVADLCEIAV